MNGKSKLLIQSTGDDIAAYLSHLEPGRRRRILHRLIALCPGVMVGTWKMDEHGAVLKGFLIEEQTIARVSKTGREDPPVLWIHAGGMGDADNIKAGIREVSGRIQRGIGMGSLSAIINGEMKTQIDDQERLIREVADAAGDGDLNQVLMLLMEYLNPE